MGIVGSLLFTGKYVDNVGSYADCVKPNSHTDYYLYTLGPVERKGPTPQPLLDARLHSHYMGICLPSACSREDVLSLQGSLESFAQVQEINYSNITLAKMPTDASPITQDADPNNLIYLLLVVIIGFVGVVLLATLVSCCLGKKD